MSLSTHVLDTASGKPAAGVPVRLERAAVTLDGATKGWRPVAQAVTDDDGRVGDLPADRTGAWRLVFDTTGHSAFYPEVAIVFVIREPADHHHVPLLLAPYGYSTYRGS
ncbi:MULTISPECIES: hydroxyisourate hydrolase [unclassified Parafrankia]|uniref:hydroxyisourate hydrolase n=1 Tax=Parafrankia TaxID=2994362 RepID=UPI000DA545F1|nr:MULTISPECIES: hydroxyisourate hydrolase [unclassified Parafrankia]TCJ34262.1 hydroxyisourate hydrolase [Parafrankia sp. BMG5.11]CAI7974683.1 5-hydroxyisourate hydrolase [Frankia sp. Hr75.2]SQD99338.1 5-hydroxyisourate hydrolase [Parafrankia sp. Ea1.12]